MKINKTEFDRETGIITVWIDEIKDKGFCFHIENIADKTELIQQIRLKSQEYFDKISEETNAENKYNLLKSAVGEEFKL